MHQQCCKQSSNSNLTFFLSILIKNTRSITVEAEHLWSFIQTRQHKKCLSSFTIKTYHLCIKLQRCLQPFSTFSLSSDYKKVMPAEKLEVIFLPYDLKNHLQNTKFSGEGFSQPNQKGITSSHIYFSASHH